MKKILTLLLLLLTLVQTGFSQSGIQDKLLRKECKKTIKLMKKGGWKVYASTASLETAVSGHFAQMEAGGGGLQLVVGHSRNKNENLAYSAARANALSQTAGMKESQISGATSLIMSNLNEGREAKSGLSFTNQFEISVRQTLKGMSPSLQVYRKVPGKKQELLTEVQMFYLVKM